MQGYVTRKGQQWYAVIYEGLDPTTGRERRRWHAAGRERRRAESLARQLADDENERRGHGRSRLTFAGFVSRHWLPAKQLQLRPTTIEGYERMLRLHILPELGSIALRDLRSETIQSFYGRLLLDGRHDNTGGLSAKTVHEIHAVIRNVLDDAVRRDLLTCNPTYLVAAPRYARARHRGLKAWNAEQLRDFLDSLTDRRHHWWFSLAACTGMRRGELVGLRWGDIDFDRHRLSIMRTVICVGARMHVSGGKTHNAARTIDLDPASVALLARWRDHHAEHFGDHDPNRWLFAKPDGSLLHPQSVSQAFERTAAASGLPKISLHGYADLLVMPTSG